MWGATKTKCQQVAPLVGAWIETTITAKMNKQLSVAPLVGAWIETVSYKRVTLSHPSHPSWVRGLKPMREVESIIADVAPLVGAWIETHCTHNSKILWLVAPLVGAWIET